MGPTYDQDHQEALNTNRWLDNLATLHGMHRGVDFARGGLISNPDRYTVAGVVDRGFFLCPSVDRGSSWTGSTFLADNIWPAVSVEVSRKIWAQHKPEPHA